MRSRTIRDVDGWGLFSKEKGNRKRERQRGGEKRRASGRKEAEKRVIRRSPKPGGTKKARSQTKPLGKTRAVQRETSRRKTYQQRESSIKVRKMTRGAWWKPERRQTRMKMVPEKEKKRLETKCIALQ